MAKRKKRPWQIWMLGRGRLWWWVIIAGNGKTLAHSEVYSSKTKCHQTASKVADRFGEKLVIKEG